VDSGGQVLETAKSETSEVVAQATQSARDLFDQVRGELTEQAGTQQHRIAGGLRDLAEELDRMGQSSGQSGLATSLVKQVSDRTRSTAEWVDGREPGDLMTEVKRYAARKPGTFLAVAGAIGFLGARLTRGLTASSSSSSSTQGNRSMTAPPSVSGEGVGYEGTQSAYSAPAMPDYRQDDGIPTVTTTSHGEPVTYTSGAAGTPAGSLSTSAQAGYLADDFPEGRA
jgi:hypothetical protein